MSIQILCKLVNVFAQPAAAADLTGDKVQLIESPGEKRKRRREARAKRSEASQVIA